MPKLVHVIIKHTPRGNIYKRHKIYIAQVVKQKLGQMLPVSPVTRCQVVCLAFTRRLDE